MTVLVTGGAGFVGANLTHRLLAQGERVRVLDDLSRDHVERNVEWLRGEHGEAFDLVVGDVRDGATVERAMRGVSYVFHLAAQVAVTTSLVDPVTDFDVNARGTLVVLEAARAARPMPGLLYTSTNKVYGACADVALTVEGNRYAPSDPALASAGFGESRPLDFHSPYGCAKGAADQYVLDWARTFGLSSCVFRMSCIYGPRQFGTEDQGWVAHFAFRAVKGEPITVYGDGRQVRDVLFVDDLVDAMLLARAAGPRIAGQAFNVGGGIGRAVSLLDVLARLEAIEGCRHRVLFEPWRTADQRWYVSDTRKLENTLGWCPRVSVEAGIAALAGWASSARGASREPERAPEATA
ncbi:MAG: GDP-mannose 4,6-dehydratase [Polyangiaceae bacterium]|nr:GDP-mannose 4,6-dehydratase [Polyangiaceae bacterium]